jgi:hypothetical protein
MRIERPVARRSREDRGLGYVLPMDARDPDIVRAKQLLRDHARAASDSRRG